MKFLRQALASIALAAVGAGACQAAVDPALYSFADVYRLTVSGAAPEFPSNYPVGSAASSAAEYQLRAVAIDTQPSRPQFSVAPAPLPAGYVFSIGAMPEPERWLLILSGLAAAAWVARRRLGYSF